MFPIPDIMLPQAEDIGYLAVFVVLALDGANVPFTPIELFLGLTGYLAAIGELKFFPALLVTLIGNITGHVISYMLGYMVGKPFFRKYGKYLLITPERLERAERMLNRMGPSAAIVFRFIPGLRAFGSILLGTVRMPFAAFLFLTSAGVLVWNAVLMTLGFYFGLAFATEAAWLVPAGIGIIAIGLCLAVILWYVQSKLRKRGAPV